MTLDDETLRDGLQNPSVSDPSIEDKIKILHLMEALGIETVNIGLAGRGTARVCGRGSAGAGNWTREIEDTSELRGANFGDGYSSHCGNFAEDGNRD